MCLQLTFKWFREKKDICVERDKANMAKCKQLANYGKDKAPINGCLLNHFFCRFDNIKNKKLGQKAFSFISAELILDCKSFIPVR